MPLSVIITVQRARGQFDVRVGPDVLASHGGEAEALHDAYNRARAIKADGGEAEVVRRPEAGVELDG